MIDEAQQAIQNENWERRKEELSFINYFKRLYENKELIKSIDSNELYQKLMQLRKAGENHNLPIISSDSNDWLPSWFWAVLRWTEGSEFFWASFDSLGVEAIKQGRRDLLETLAKTGDEKARLKKPRTKLPKQLIGKKLTFEKISKNEWSVKVEEPTFDEKLSEYDKLFYDYVDYNTDRCRDCEFYKVKNSFCDFEREQKSSYELACKDFSPKIED